MHYANDKPNIIHSKLLLSLGTLVIHLIILLHQDDDDYDDEEILSMSMFHVDVDVDVHSGLGRWNDHK